MRASDESIGRLEHKLGVLLRAGVLTSAGCLAVGLGITLAGYRADAFLTVGLVLLIATPILRVAVSFVEYVRMREWLFAGVTLFVLLVLTGTVIVALR